MGPNPTQIGYPIRIGSADATPADAITSPSTHPTTHARFMASSSSAAAHSSRVLGSAIFAPSRAEADVTGVPGTCQGRGRWGDASMAPHSRNREGGAAARAADGPGLLHERMVNEVLRIEFPLELPESPQISSAFWTTP